MDAIKLQFIQMLQAGCPEALALQFAGWRRADLSVLLAEDTEFAEEYRRVEARKAIRRVAVLERAADEGDWKAAAWLLERDAGSRDAFSVKPQPIVQIDVAGALRDMWKEIEGGAGGAALIENDE